MAPEALKAFSRRVLPVFALLALLLVALDLMSSAVQNSATLSRLFIPLLVFSVLGLVALVVLIVFNLVRLLGQFRRREPGSRLTARMVAMFVLLSVLPVTVVYYYSLQFLLRGIDSWFDVQIDQAMEDALALGQASLDLHKRVRLRQTERMLTGISDASEAAMALSLGELRLEYGAQEVTLMNKSGGVIASSIESPAELVPDMPHSTVIQQVRNGENFVGLVLPDDGELMQVRVVVADPDGRPLLLQALYTTSAQITEFSERVQGSYTRYKELAFLRGSLKFSFTLTLSLVLLFALLSAVWAAFSSARRLVAPIRDIAAGTRAVADGDYGQQLPVPGAHDELGFLVASFNTMTRRIALARDEADRSKREVEAQRAYLQTVLGRLLSGVMVFSADLRLRISNQAAEAILRVGLGPYLDRPVDELAEASPSLRQFVDLLETALRDNDSEWREEVSLYGGDGRQVLLCRSTPLAVPEEQGAGHVLVFDDVTALIKAQRDAAWGEVARRLAHEIKNPLTPIQLAAERLRRKYLSRLPESEVDVLDRATHTIVQQVEAMKEMVNAFSDYARPPRMRAEPLEIDALVSEIMDLYSPGESGPGIEVRLGAHGARIEADPMRLRQVVHNLVKNAQEAVGDVERGRIEVATAVREDRDCRFVEIRVEDNGPGFSAEVLSHLFEPYVTTKAKGTGLGLAIVKKIVEEHGGMISAHNCPGGGGCVVLRLPQVMQHQHKKAARVSAAADGARRTQA
ncbi:MAG: ATP-binding protein [Chromatiales bacterium]|jgi:nitrogen fixation/metabolism regulation signal transduction histidine kinase